TIVTDLWPVCSMIEASLAPLRAAVVARPLRSEWPQGLSVDTHALGGFLNGERHNAATDGLCAHRSVEEASGDQAFGDPSRGDRGSEGEHRTCVRIPAAGYLDLAALLRIPVAADQDGQSVAGVLHGRAIEGG